MTLASFDPGQHGAVAFLTPSGELISVHDMPTRTPIPSGLSRLPATARVSCVGIIALLRASKPSGAIVEAVGCRPTDGRNRVLTMGKGVGAIVDALEVCDVPVVAEPVPAKWKADMGLSSDKEASRAMALALFPAHAAMFKRKKDHDRAEACLLGVWHVRMLAGAFVVAKRKRSV